LFYAVARNKAECVVQLLKSEKIDVHGLGIGLDNNSEEAVEVLLGDERLQITPVCISIMLYAHVL